jgi:Cys-tRNA(Pro)/Cys-tRNA(Cys) deacylase
MPAPTIKTNVLRLLENAGIAFAWHEFDVSDGKLDARTCAERVGALPDQVFKTLVTTGAVARTYFVFVVPATGELDLKKAAKACGQKYVEMLPQKELLPLTGYVHGGCSPIGQKKLFPTYIDETAQLFDRIFVSGGHTGLNVELSPEDLRKFVNAEYADLTK